MPAQQTRPQTRRKSQRSPAKLPKTITLERVGQYDVIRSHCEHLLGDLATNIHVAAVHQSEGFLTVPIRQELFNVENANGQTEVIIRAGLEPVVTTLLQRAGHTVVVEPRPILNLASPEPTSGVAGPVDRTLPSFIAEHERGLLCLGPGVCPASLVAQVYLAFPGATIAVAASRLEDVRRFGRALQEHVPETFYSTASDFPENTGPVVVATYGRLGEYEVALDRRDILITLDALESLGKENLRTIDFAKRARLFGLTQIDPRFAPYDRDRLWAWYGFHSLQIPRHGCVVRPVEVVTFKINKGGLKDRPSVVELKQLGLWNHPIRNRQIVHIAKALASPESGSNDAQATGSTPGVVILVEAAAHAFRLAQKLTGWSLLLGQHVDTASVPKANRPNLVPPDNRYRATPVRAIATTNGFGQIDLNDVDALIRADGGFNFPNGLTATALAAAADRDSLSIVDFDDLHHPQLRIWSRKRREAYLAWGWVVDAHGGPQSPFDLFQATRRPGRTR